MAKGKYAEWLEPDNLILLQGWARNGVTEEQIAKNMGINPATLREWKHRFPAIDAALKKTREIVDTEVENALLKSAMGYWITQTQLVKVKVVRQDGHKKIEEERVEKHPVDVFIPPNSTAQIFWLKCRKRKEWQDRGIEPIDKDAKVTIVDDFE